MIKNILALFIASAIISSCYYDIEDELYGTIECVSPEVISYSDDIIPIVNLSCGTTGCHTSTGPAPGYFANYDEIKLRADDGSLELLVVVNKSMPIGSILDPCDVELFKLWIEQGSPNN